MKLSELLELSGIDVVPARDPSIAGVTDDSRSVRPGWLFVGVRGTARDGRQYYDEAAKAGAVAIAGCPPAPGGLGVDFVPLADDRSALARLAAAFWGRPDRDMTLFGVTGTNGKTTVTWLLERIHAAAGKRCGVVGTIEYRVGDTCVASSNTTPGPVVLWKTLSDMRGLGARAVAMEVSSHALHQHRVDGLEFAAVIVTNVTSEHLDYHGTFNDYFETKAKILDHVVSGGTAVINLDDRASAALAGRVGARTKCVTVSRRVDVGADVSAESVKLGADGTRFSLRSPQGSVLVHARLIGRHNLSNMLQAAAAALATGLSLDAVARGLGDIECVPGRLERVLQDAPFDVFVDYAHTPDALQSILETLRPLARGRLIVVFGCGGDRDRTKRPRMGSIAERLADHVVLTADNPRSEEAADIVDAILAGITCRAAVDVEIDRSSAIKTALGSAAAGDIVLIAGKGHEKTQIFADRVVPFDDVHAARNAWASLAASREVSS